MHSSETFGDDVAWSDDYSAFPTLAPEAATAVDKVLWEEAVGWVAQAQQQQQQQQPRGVLEREEW